MAGSAYFSNDILQKKLLVVGAGGIGCELLKNLAMAGFLDVEVIDLDTIDVSNLNRQFLFRREHVGKSKAKVASEAALAMRSDMKIVYKHGSIFENEYDVEYFKRFAVVLNALDNLGLFFICFLLSISFLLVFSCSSSRQSFVHQWPSSID